MILLGSPVRNSWRPSLTDRDATGIATLYAWRGDISQVLKDIKEIGEIGEQPMKRAPPGASSLRRCASPISTFCFH